MEGSAEARGPTTTTREVEAGEGREGWRGEEEEWLETLEVRVVDCSQLAYRGTGRWRVWEAFWRERPVKRRGLGL